MNSAEPVGPRRPPRSAPKQGEDGQDTAVIALVLGVVLAAATATAIRPAGRWTARRLVSGPRLAASRAGG